MAVERRTAQSVLLSKLFAAAVGFPASILMARVLLGDVGPTEYGFIVLVGAIPGLLPFADLGMGAAIINAVTDVSADHKASSARAEFGAAIRVSAAAAAVLFVGGWVIYVAGAWPLILGQDAASIPGLTLAATLVVNGVALNIVLSASHRVLHATRRNVEINLITGAIPLIALGCTLAIKAASVAHGYFALNIITGTLLCTCALVIRASRHYPGSIRSDVLSPEVGRTHVRRVFQVGLPSVISAAAIVLAFQTDRLVIGHLSTPIELTRYSLVAPLALALQAIMRPVAMNIWPRYRSALATRQLSIAEVRRDCLTFFALGTAAGVSLVGFGPFVTGLMGADQVVVPQRLILIFAILLVIQSTQMPLESLLTSKSGFRAQATAATAMAVVNLLLSLVLCPQLGAEGAVLASVIAVLTVQLPTLVMSSRTLLSDCET